MVRLSPEDDTEPRDRVLEVLVPAGAVVCSLVGAIVIGVGDTAPMTAFGALTALMGVGGGVSWLTQRRLGHTSVARPRGAGRTRIPGSIVLLVLPLVAGTAILAACTAAAIWLAWSDQLVLAVLPGALGILTAVSLAGPLARGGRTDFVDLSVDGIEWQYFGARHAVGWDDIEGAAGPPGPRGVVPLRLVDGRRPRQLRRGWPLWLKARPPAEFDQLFTVVATRNLRVDAFLLARVITRLTQDPASRELLGTPGATDLHALAGDTTPLY